ncbi:MAG: alcohol dehydrogenase catalytic domain-containing protein [Spirochaetes bacterium]|nr:alcohol dehydrogenase catalytic domain-containing protein [Spirochaetota bacterium]
MKGTMKAQVFYEPLKMEYKEIDIPQIGVDEVLVKVHACGICGSDISYYWGDSRLETKDGKGPLVLGHEISGEIVEIGALPEELGLFSIGDRVGVDPVQYCNACEVCRMGQVNLCENKTVIGVSVDGGFCEYVKAKYTSVLKLPKEVSYEQGAFIEPLADAMYAVSKLEVELGNFCIVIGPGPIGLAQAQLIKSSGAGKVAVAGTRDYRLEIARKNGADYVFNTVDKGSKYYVDNLKAKISELTGGKMADRVLVATGNPKIMHMPFELSGRRAVIVFFGLPGDKDFIQVPALDTIFWDKTLKFSWLAPLMWPKSINAIAAKLIDVDALVTHKYKLEELTDALKKVKNRESEPLKAIVVP